MRRNGRITAYIDLQAVEHNFNSMKENLVPGTKVIAVIKTDGYGHGAAEIAKFTEGYEYIWGFAVAAFSEAEELRNAGITKPILILGYSFEENYEQMVDMQIRPAIFTMDMAQKFAEAALKKGVQAPFHLAVDTGMSRIGISCDEKGMNLAESICALPGLKPEGIFTHFSRADETDKSYTVYQLERFRLFCSRLESKGIQNLIRHCSNSASIIDMKDACMDAVRAGISIYGIYPSDEVNKEQVRLKHVMELKSHIVYLKEVEKGTQVSYGGTYVAPERRRIATVPVGYGDGYPRSLSSKACVLIRGKRAPIIGRICMDQFMVDVTEIEAEHLDEVTLIGRDGDEEITVEELSGICGRFPYEFICDIGKRVPRVYLNA